MHENSDCTDEQWPEGDGQDRDWPLDWAPSAGSGGRDWPPATGVPPPGRAVGERSPWRSPQPSRSARAGAVYLYKSAIAGSVRARVTSATRFTGADRSLTQVRVCDTVAVQITESAGVARVISLQDPAPQ